MAPPLNLVAAPRPPPFFFLPLFLGRSCICLRGKPRSALGPLPHLLPWFCVPLTSSKWSPCFYICPNTPTPHWLFPSIWAEELQAEVVQCPVVKAWRLSFLVTIQQFYFHCSVILVPKCDCIDLWNVDKWGGTLFPWNIRALCYYFFAKMSLRSSWACVQPCRGEQGEGSCWAGRGLLWRLLAAKQILITRAHSPVVTGGLPLSNALSALRVFLSPQKVALPMLGVSLFQFH